MRICQIKRSPPPSGGRGGASPSDSISLYFIFFILMAYFSLFKCNSSVCLIKRNQYLFRGCVYFYNRHAWLFCDIFLKKTCIIQNLWYIIWYTHGAVAQLARASHWQCEGREFESLLLHHFCFAKMVNEAWKGFASCTEGALHGTQCRFILLCAWHARGVQDTKCFIKTPFQMKQLHFIPLWSIVPFYSTIWSTPLTLRMTCHP